ncbi:hypothetical protein APED_29795 [Acanthopleuribacter pedis]
MEHASGKFDASYGLAAHQDMMSTSRVLPYEKRQT